MGYKYVDEITSDVMFEVKAKTFEEVLSDAAKAMLNIMYDISKVNPQKEVIIRTEGDDEKEALHNWLSEVLAQWEIAGLMLSEFDVKVTRKNGVGIEAVARGEPTKNDMIQTLVKGVTYYKYDLKKAKDGYTATVVVDI
ncbi:MAG: archease [Candidatus Diapherotrites archaeon]|nr:archease [Candidatus Diapherotrites archaeon]